jgi:hypothetical protein
MKPATRERMASSAFPHWCTPPDVCALLHAFGNVALDPCSNAYSMVRAGVELRRGGLHAMAWAERAPKLHTDPRAFAYVNSPYGAALPRWTARIVLEHRECGIEVVQLMPARIETRWFRAARDGASSIGIVRGRLRFWRRGKQRHPAFFPSALLYYGSRVREFERVFSSIADFYRYVRPAAAAVAVQLDALRVFDAARREHFGVLQ